MLYLGRLTPALAALDETTILAPFHAPLRGRSTGVSGCCFFICRIHATIARTCARGVGFPTSCWPSSELVDLILFKKTWSKVSSRKYKLFMLRHRLEYLPHFFNSAKEACQLSIHAGHSDNLHSWSIKFLEDPKAGPDDNSRQLDHKINRASVLTEVVRIRSAQRRPPEPPRSVTNPTVVAKINNAERLNRPPA